MFETTIAPDGAFASQFLRGARICLPVAVSIAAYGLVWGVLAGQAGLSLLETALMSGIVFAGSAQFVALTLWTEAPSSLPIGALVLAALIVNLRYLLLTATLRPLFAGAPLWRTGLGTFLVTDETWALSVAELGKGKGTLAFLLGAGVMAYFAWMASTLSGRLVGAAIEDPARYGLDFAFTATFLALLLGMWRGRGNVVPWMVAALAAMLAVKFLPPSWHILVGGLSGSLAGALMETRRAARVAR